MDDKQYIQKAIELAGQSAEPVGCGAIIVIDGQIVAEAFNSQRTDQLAISHAEIKAVSMANKKLGKRKLVNATAYCSCEPCPMCVMAMSLANVERIVYARTFGEVFPDDALAQYSSQEFARQLDYAPKLEQFNI